VWAAIAARTQDVYVADITVGETRVLRGHWSDRLADIDADIAAVAAMATTAKPAQAKNPVKVARAISESLGRPTRPVVTGRHTAPATFTPGRALAVEFAASVTHESVQLHYRQVNQAERWGERADAGGRARLARSDSRGVHAEPISAAVLLRGADGAGIGRALSRPRTSAQ